MAQALDQTAHHHQRHGGVFREAAGKVRPAEQQHIGLHLGPHRGRMRLVVDDAHLADVVARPSVARITSRPRAVGRYHARPARQQNGQGVGLCPLLHQHLTALVALLGHRPADHLRLRHREQREQWHPAQQVQVDNMVDMEKTSPQQQNRTHPDHHGFDGFLTITTIENGLFLCAAPSADAGGLSFYFPTAPSLPGRRAQHRLVPCPSPNTRKF